ncbi:MAG: ABC transporter permease [Coprococcus sp.]|nr:ABC transporter permease [Coprococcus sp.]
MNRYGQLVYKYLKNNKKRTVSTILGVVMGAILIFGVINIVFCQIQKGLDNAKEMYRFDAVFYNLGENDAKVIQNYPGVKTSYPGGFDEKMFMAEGIVFVDDFNENPYNIELKTGTYPKEKNQIIANVTTETGFCVGDIVTLYSGNTGFDKDIDLEVVGTFTLNGDFNDISYYEYSFINYMGFTGDIPENISAVYVSYENPYKLSKLTKEIAETTGTEYFINDSIALYYNQTSDGSIQAIFAALVFALIVIIACMAAFVIKNTLRLSVAERMKDYGVLRCAGASLKQLSYMVRKEALMIGGISSMLGIIISYVIQVIFSLVSVVYDFRHFYMLGAVITILVCVITMLIATIEPCNIIKRLTPVEAVRNHMKTSDKEIIKLRKAKLVTKLFGIGGSYAYKNVMRNPKQFVTRVLSLTLGIVLFTCTQTICDSFQEHYRESLGIGDVYYNVVIDYEEAWIDIVDDSGTETDMPSVSEFCKNRDMAVSQLKQLPEVGDSVSKRNLAAYKGYCLTLGIEKKDFDSLYTKDFLKRFSATQLSYPEDETDTDAKRIYAARTMTLSPLVASYDADMFYMYKDYLADGTCDVDEMGDDGILICNRFSFYEEDEDTGIEVKKTIDVMNIKVGDTLSLVAAPKDVYDRKMEDMCDRYYDRYHNDYAGEDAREALISDYNMLIRYDAYQELYDEGYIKTYTVKGIVESNALENLQFPSIIMTNTQFREFMPEWENEYDVGMYVCHTDGFDNDVYNILKENNAYSLYLDEGEMFKGIDTVKNTCSIILIIILLFMTINIFNNTSSSMVFRKGEFALLRCIGMSKKKLTYVVLLEGIIATIFAAVLGIAISVIALMLMSKYMYYIGYSSLVIPYGKVGLAILLLFAIMTLASWIPLQSIKKEIAPALAEADE